MTLIRRVLIAMAAGAGFVAPAVAQDEPVIAPLYEKIDLCAALGEGYFEIPGTQTCMRVRAGVRTDYNVDVDLGGSSRVYDNGGGTSGFRSQGNLTAGSVTQTEFGPLRTHIDINVR